MGSRETSTLIAADKVEGTAVYNTQGESLGTIHNVMIEKRSGKVAYAIMSFGGFLGMGKEYHPLPWNLLKYDTDRGGYVVNLDKRKLEGAPHYSDEQSVAWGDAAWDRKVHDYYGVGRSWE